MERVHRYFNAASSAPLPRYFKLKLNETIDVIRHDTLNVSGNLTEAAHFGYMVVDEKNTLK
jgi:hypothetical protein